MKPDLESLGDGSTDGSDVVMAIDEIDGRRHVVIADITGDGGWVTVPEPDAIAIDDWR